MPKSRRLYPPAFPGPRALALRTAAAAGLLFGAASLLAAQQSVSQNGPSPAIAWTLSAVGTAAPIAAAILDPATNPGGLNIYIAAGGFVVGPMAGYLYGGKAGRGLAHAGIRAAVLGVAVGGATLLCARKACDTSGGTYDGGRTLSAGLLIGVGAVSTVGLAIEDILHVGGAVRARKREVSAISVQPTYSPRSHAAGFAVNWQR